MVLSCAKKYFCNDLRYALLRSAAVPAGILNHRPIQQFIVAFERDHRMEIENLLCQIYCST